MKLDFAPSQAARWIARAFTCFLLGAALAVILVGCKAPAPHMRPAMSRGIVPDPAAATVVFVRPSSMAGAIRPVIATAQGRFLGESEARSVFVAKLPPGDHLLLSWSEGTPALRATLAAGRVYFVEVAPKMGAWSARVQLLALRPRDENWRELEEWLRKCDAIEADVMGGEAHLRRRAADLGDQIRAAEQRYQGYDEEDREKRTLRPEDGVAQAFGEGPPMGVGGVAPASGGHGAPAPMALPQAAPPQGPSTPARPGPDTVFLKGGGRIRGTVMEDEPTRLSIRLLDGTTRVVRRSEVDRLEYGNP